MKEKIIWFDEALESPLLSRILIFCFALAAIILTFVANGTCDEGDSVMHYQFAQFAFQHHELFFHHWAKPLYVLIASPFAQFGFTGMKIFQITVSSLTIFMATQTGVLLKIKRASLIALFMFLSPALITHTLSGLTEPLFALVLIASVYLYLKEKFVWSLLLLSFLPFVRSEGLLICGVFGILLLIEKRFWLLPLLAFGHIVYSIAGYATHGNLLWVFTQIPYARMDSMYGKGTWSHFFVNLPVITGVPLCILLVAGTFAGVLSLRKIFADKKNMREVFLIYGCFAAYFIAHVCFWALGIFNSFGMLRVLIGVLPLMAIIELRGLNMLVDWIGNALVKVAISIAIILYILIFPFTKNIYGWNYKNDFCLNISQQLLVDMSSLIRTQYPDYKNCNYYFDANYTSVVMNFDFFDSTVSRRTWETWEHPPKKSFLVWDDWYSKFEMNRSLEEVMNDNRFVLVKEFTQKDGNHNERKVALFKSKDF